MIVLASQSLNGQGASNKGEHAMNPVQIIQNALDKNPEMRLVLEIAARAREVESRELPRDIGLATDIAVVPTNSQSLVPPSTHD